MCPASEASVPEIDSSSAASQGLPALLNLYTVHTAELLNDLANDTELRLQSGRRRQSILDQFLEIQICSIAFMRMMACLSSFWLEQYCCVLVNTPGAAALGPAPSSLAHIRH